MKDYLAPIWEWLKKHSRNLKMFFSSWTYLVQILTKRIVEGFRNIDFVIYFIVVVVIVGGLGFSDLIYKKFILEINTPEMNFAFAKALSIYFIAIIATSSADLILNRKPNEKEARSLRMPGLTFLILGGIITFLIQYNLTPFSLKLAYYGVSGALFLWWITNSMDKKYNNTTDDEERMAAIGGIDLEDKNKKVVTNVKLY